MTKKKTVATRENINGTKEEFKYLIKGGKVRSENSKGRSIRWAERVEKKKKELGADGIWELKSVVHVPSISHCEFCNHEIVRKFFVNSKPEKDSGIESVELAIGSECTKYFTSLDSVIEIILYEIKSRRYKLDCALKMKKIYNFMIENKALLQLKRIDWESYKKITNLSHLDVLKGYIRSNKKPQVTEWAMKKLGIEVDNDWYTWTEEEEKLRNDIRNITRIDGNDIYWSIPDSKIPEMPRLIESDF